MRISIGTVVLVALLGACGSKDSGSNKVKMSDMEVVDGTATDAMTDLDAARNEGTPMMAGGNSAAPAKAQPPSAANAAAKDAEVVAQD
jgi:hypothetical protein